MRYEQIRFTDHARKRMRQRKISRAQVIRTLQNPTLRYTSYDKLVAQGETGANNTIFVYYVELAAGEALVISVKRRAGRG